MNDNSGCAWLFIIAILAGIAHSLYVNRLEWIVYAVGVIFIVWAIISLVQSSQLNQKVELLERLAKKISNNWK